LDLRASQRWTQTEKKLSVVDESCKTGFTAAAMIKRNNKHKQRKQNFKA
jgi:hypothetical protein